jgi:hypothetical protein
LLSNGTAMSWGSNLSLQLGFAPKTKVVKEEEEEFIEEDEQPENSSVPVPVRTLTGATAVAAGGEYSLALLGGGEVAAWGGNLNGQLGNGSSGGMSSFPTAVGGLSGATSIAAGAGHALALLSGGTVVGWGYNPDGQLGNDSNLNSLVPVAVAGLGGVAGIAGGVSHSLSFGAPIATVTALSPSAGPEAGGTSVTITGTNLAETTGVQFGAAPASSFTVNSATSITAVSPPGSGVVDVAVTSPVNTSPASAGDKFTYVPPPTITKIVPKKGPATGGTSVTITGKSLMGATAVSFGVTPAASFTVNSATSISAVSPAGTAGPAPISVTTPSGTSSATTADIFKYEAPTLTSLTPNAGPAAGGTLVVATGTGFAPGTGATVFKFGTALASSVSCESTMTCTFVTPAKKATTVDVVALAGKLKSVATPPGDLFTFE